MKQKFVFMMALLVLVALVAVPVSAETVSGNLNYDYSGSSEYTGANAGLIGVPFEAVYTKHIELTSATHTLVRFGPGVTPDSYDTDNPGMSTSADMRLDSWAGTSLGQATIGYQRKYNILGEEIAGYQYVIFPTEYNSAISGLSGTHVLFLCQSVFHVTTNSASYHSDDGTFSIGNTLDYYVSGGSYSTYKVISFSNSYTAANATGIGITGTVKKTISGIESPSKTIIYNGNTGEIIASEQFVNPTDFDFNILEQPIIIGVVNSLSVQINSSVLFPQAIATPVAIPYNITLTPNNAVFGAPISARINGNTTGGTITAVSWFADYPGDINGYTSHNLYEAGSATNGLNYVRRSGTWYGWSDASKDYTVNKGTTIPNPVSIIPAQAGTYNIWVRIYLADGTIQDPSAQIIVGQGSDIRTLVLQAANWQTGNLVTGTTWNIKNLATNNWSNASGSIYDGTRTVQYPIGTTLLVQATNPYYSPANLTQTLLGNDIWTLQLYPIGVGSTTPGNTTLMVLVKGVDQASHLTPLSQAQVVLSDGQTKITTESGMVQFAVTNNTVYSASVQAQGYTSVTKSFLALGSIYSVQILLPSIYITTAPTLAPGQTATPTPAPTIDSRTNAQKQESVINIIYDNAESIAWALIILFFIGCVKMAMKGWNFGWIFRK